MVEGAQDVSGEETTNKGKCLFLVYRVCGGARSGSDLWRVCVCGCVLVSRI